MSLSPTPRQLELLRFIRGYHEAHGHGPSYREIAESLTLASKSSIHRLVVRCEERGLLRRLPCQERSIEILAPPAIPHAPDGAPLFFIPFQQEAAHAQS